MDSPRDARFFLFRFSGWTKGGHLTIRIDGMSAERGRIRLFPLGKKPWCLILLESSPPAGIVEFEGSADPLDTERVTLNRILGLN